MLNAEAKWLYQALNALPTQDLDPLLSIGSGDKWARSEKQPWIDREIFSPLGQRGIHAFHHELHPGQGVDVAGDLLDSKFRSSLADLAPRAILCANVLEHLSDRTKVIEGFLEVLPPGGLLLVTVPRRFPYHPDPIDTMFRPTVSELARECAPFELIRGESVRCESVVGYLLRSPDKVTSIRNGLRSMSGPKPTHQRPAQQSLSPIGRLWQVAAPTEVTCCLFRSPR